MRPKYCVVNWRGDVVRKQITLRQAVAFCIKHREYDVGQHTEHGVRLTTWVADLSLYTA